VQPQAPNIDVPVAVVINAGSGGSGSIFVRMTIAESLSRLQDVYINGTLRQHHTLTQLPDQTNDSVVIGSGWNGLVGRAIYYPRSLSYSEIHTMASAEPPPYNETVIGKNNYFDITWYTGRLNSS
jgi:hypothetical protein